ncbi:MAG: glycosyltransferase [Ignavibacteria bacterium]|nr:glycosyltransferase [Ignavibacteria bacterium]
MGVSPGKELLRAATIGPRSISSQGWRTTRPATNKLFEYAACGLPVIVPDTEPYRAYLGQESWCAFADPERPDSIAQAAKTFLTDIEMYERSCRAARNAFETKLNFETAFLPVLEALRFLSSNS